MRPPPDQSFAKLLERLLHDVRPPRRDPNDPATLAATLAAMRAENSLLPARLVETVVLAGFLKPEDIPLLGLVQLAPGVICEADRLSWDPEFHRVVFVNDAGGSRSIERFFRYLAYGSDECDWQHVPADQPAWLTSRELAGQAQVPPPVPASELPYLPAADPSEPPTVPRRLALELETVLEIRPCPQLAEHVTPLHASPFAVTIEDGGPFTVVDLGERWHLQCRDTASLAVLPTMIDAGRAADDALLGERDRFIWLDRFDQVEPD